MAKVSLIICAICLLIALGWGLADDYQAIVKGKAIIRRIRPAIVIVPMFLLFWILPITFEALDRKAYHWLLVVVPALPLFYWTLKATGWSVDGVTESFARQALSSSLEKLAIPFQETKAGVQIPDLGAEISIHADSFQSSVGLNTKNNSAMGKMPEIARTMNEYFSANRGNMRLGFIWFTAILNAAVFLGVATFLGLAIWPKAN